MVELRQPRKLTRRQQQVMAGVRAGKTLQRIAHELRISVASVHNHLTDAEATLKGNDLIKKEKRRN